jgi:hypothetical protein
VTRVALAARWALWLGLALLTVRFATHTVASNYAGESPLHLVDLVFHEAGHVLWSPLGRVLMVLGGSLTQLIVPVVCTVALLRRDDPFGASVAAWWTGQNLVDLAPYIDDARSLRLILLGGRTGAEVEGHDWEFLLQTLGLLHRDHAIAAAVHAVGLVVMSGALAWGARALLGRRRAREDVAGGGDSEPVKRSAVSPEL